MDLRPQFEGRLYVGHDATLRQQKAPIRLIHGDDVSGQAVAGEARLELVSIENFVGQVMDLAGGARLFALGIPGDGVVALAAARH